MKKDIHVNLPKHDLEYLDALAKEQGRTRNDLVCEAVGAYRVSRKKAQVEADMRRDVETLAEENMKLFREIEPHAMECLLKNTEW